MRRLPSYDEITGLPAGPRLTVPVEYGDENGHLNVRHYVGIFDDAEWAIYEHQEMGASAAAAQVGGVFMLEQFVTYRREVAVGDEVQVHVRFIARSERMFHLVSYLANLTRHQVAASMEGLECWVDLRTRRIAPIPSAGMAALDRHIAAAAALPWTPELSGTITL